MSEEETLNNNSNQVIKSIAIEVNDDDSNEKEIRRIGANGTDVDIYRDPEDDTIIYNESAETESVAKTLNFVEAHIDYTYELIDGLNQDVSHLEDADYINQSNLAEGYQSGDARTYEAGDFTISDEGILQKFDGTDWAPKNVTDEIKEMKSTFQNGVDRMYDALVSNGVTPSASTPSGIEAGIDELGLYFDITTRVYMPASPNDTIGYNWLDLSSDDKTNNIGHIEWIRAGSGNAAWLFPNPGTDIQYRYYALDKDGYQIIMDNAETLFTSNGVNFKNFNKKVCTIQIVVNVDGSSPNGNYSYAPACIRFRPRVQLNT